MNVVYLLPYFISSPLASYCFRLQTGGKVFHKVSNLVSQLTSQAESKMALNIHIPAKKEYRISKEWLIFVPNDIRTTYYE